MEGDGERKETVGNPLGGTRRHGVRKLPALNANVAREMDRRAGAHGSAACVRHSVSLSFVNSQWVLSEN